MNYMGETYISTKYRKEQFNDLRLNMRSSDSDWNFAIDIFEDRIKGRYLDIIDRIISENNLMVDGFSVMSLNCLLVETLLQFRKGWNETPSGQNRIEYTRFLIEEFSIVFTNKKLAEKFYSDIRCGILHSAQTKNGSQLTINEDYIVKFINRNNSKSISVDVARISTIIREYFINYVEKLRNSDHENERYFFLQKMKCLCEN